MSAIHQTSDFLFCVRRIGPEDRDALAALFARLSPESRYRRFLSPKPELTPRELARLSDVDHADHGAFAAIDPRDGSIIAESRYARDAGRPEAAQIAVAVADEVQGLGIGTALARLAVQRARASGFAVLIATTLWDNRRSRSILRRLGFRECGSDGSVVEYALRLT